MDDELVAISNDALAIILTVTIKCAWWSKCFLTDKKSYTITSVAVEPISIND
jgi:hypothetical protein